MAATTISAFTIFLTSATLELDLRLPINICSCIVIMALRAMTVFCSIVNQYFFNGLNVCLDEEKTYVFWWMILFKQQPQKMWASLLEPWNSGLKRLKLWASSLVICDIRRVFCLKDYLPPVLRVLYRLTINMRQIFCQSDYYIGLLSAIFHIFN